MIVAQVIFFLTWIAILAAAGPGPTRLTVLIWELNQQMGVLSLHHVKMFKN